MRKIGRNELCPCGSEEKYKKYCLEKDIQKRKDIEKEKECDERDGTDLEDEFEDLEKFLENAKKLGYDPVIEYKSRLEEIGVDTVSIDFGSFSRYYTKDDDKKNWVCESESW